ncbi:MAG: ABC transporter substrate-binding protein [Promethearchaeota archaeon]
MEKRKKKILAIVLIVVVVNTVSGVGAWFLFQAWFHLLSHPEDGFDYPGAPAGFNKQYAIKIGCVGDTGEIQGDANYEGAWFAVKKINEAGGITINGPTYYFGVTKEDTDESNPNLVSQRGVDAVNRLIYDKQVDFAVGGFRSEALLAYVEEFMAAEMIFIDTGAASDYFCEYVRDDYANYKYFWRFMPINSTALAGQILETLAGFIVSMNASYPNHEVKQIGILAEDLTWVNSLVAAVQTYLPYYTNLTSMIMTGKPWVPTMLTPIFYDITLNAADMNTHLASLAAYGADIVIPVISAQGGVLLMQQYAAYQYPYLLFGIDVQSQLDTFWAQSEGDCVYETIMQPSYACDKTATSWDFWFDFIAEFGHEPLYIAVGAYDAVNALRDAIVATQSLDTDGIIAYMETWDKSNPHPGVSGDSAWWPNTHDLVVGYPYGYTLWTQWQTDGTKNVVPAAIYPNVGSHGNIVTGPYVVAPWVNTAWS